MRERVIALVTAAGGFRPGFITPGSAFVADADALDTVEWILEFEEAFGITIPDEEAETIPTVGQAI